MSASQLYNFTASMNPAQQQFTVINLERTSRGLPAINDMSATLNSCAQIGANAATDPTTTNGCGATGYSSYAANYCGGATVLECDFAYMYDDGAGSGNTNCAALGDCWGHRNNILDTYTACPGYLGVANAYLSGLDNANSSTMLLAYKCGAAPTDIIFTWSQALNILNGGSGSTITTPPPPAPNNIVGVAEAPNGSGYWTVGSDGGVFSYGAVGFYGSMGGIQLAAPVVGMTPTPDGGGYWLVAKDGGIFSFGDAGFYGSMGGKHLDAPIVGMAATADGRGYWLVGSDGGIFAFGDAGFAGSMGGQHLNAPIVGMAATPNGGGYWLVGSDGGIFAFGDAGFAGSTGNIHLNAPIVAMSVDKATGGYWLVAKDGGIFSFNATYYGSLPGNGINVDDVAGMGSSADGNGYEIVQNNNARNSFGGISVSADSTPSLDAQCSTMNVPTYLLPGQNFSATMYVTNTGGAWWSDLDGLDYTFNSISNTDWGRFVLELSPSFVNPGNAANFFGTFTAPQQTGIHLFAWQMMQSNNSTWFGPQCDRFIIVLPLSQSSSMTGKITNAITRKPIRDASIELIGNNTGTYTHLTNKLGKYRFNDLAPESYYIVIKAPGYNARLTAITTYKSQASTEDFMLTPY